MNWTNKAKRLLGNRTIHLEGDGQFAFVTPSPQNSRILSVANERRKQSKP